MKISKKESEETLKLICVFLFIFLIYIFTGCPIRLFTGVSCAGCGMSRAYLSLMHFDVIKAFHYHPLFVCPMIVVSVFILSKFGFPQKYAKAIYGVTVFLFLGVYVYRMFDPNDRVVVFEPQNGLVFKAIKFIISYLRQ